VAGQGEGEGLVSRPVDPRDVAAGRLSVCQLRSGTLSVAAGKFAALLAREPGRIAE
jgi:hypothetical protein